MVWDTIAGVEGVEWHRFPLGPVADPAAIAHNLFDGLLSLETAGVQMVLIEEVEEDREGLAIMKPRAQSRERICADRVPIAENQLEARFAVHNVVRSISSRWNVPISMTFHDLYEHPFRPSFIQFCSTEKANKGPYGVTSSQFFQARAPPPRFWNLGACNLGGTMRTEPMA